MSYSYYIVYKPFRVLSQFTAEDGKQTLKDYFQVPKDVYSVGRLDYDSEGLLILTNDNYLKSKVINPKSACKKTYYCQVEGLVNVQSIDLLCSGVEININSKIHKTLPALVEIIEEPSLPERIPPIRYRANIPTTWLKITISEGKNRQVRKMTAAVGYPTLRLIRFAIEELNIKEFISGDIKEINQKFVYNSLKIR
jgi:23S rRNA pseudouridine2457 synthase